MNTLAAIAIAAAWSQGHDGITIHLARQQAQRDFREAELVARAYVAEQKREWKKARARYYRAIKSRNRRAARLARQEMGTILKGLSMQNQINRRVFFHRTGR